MDRDQVKYRLSHSDDRCGSCTFFMRPNRCELVGGDIRAGGICDRYERKRSLTMSRGHGGHAV